MFYKDICEESIRKCEIQSAETEMLMDINHIFRLNEASLLSKLKS